VSVRIYVYISYNFVSINVQLLKRYQGNSSRSDLQLCPPLQKNVGGRIFEDVRELEAFVTLWLVTKDKDVCQQGIKNVVLRNEKCLSCGRDLRIAVQRNMTCFLV